MSSYELGWRNYTIAYRTGCFSGVIWRSPLLTWEGERAMENQKQFAINDIVEMKKPHPCGENRWKIIRLGMDIRIKCLGCDHSVLMPRKEFTRKLKKVLVRHAE